MTIYTAPGVISGNGKTVRIAAFILLIYYLAARFVNYQTFGSIIVDFKLDLPSIFFIINLFYLPAAITLTLLNKPIGWVLLTVLLVFDSTLSLITFLLEIISPQEIYHHPDSWTHTTRAEILWMAIIPLFFWLMLLWLTQRNSALIFYKIDRNQQHRIIFFAFTAAVLFKTLF